MNGFQKGIKIFAIALAAIIIVNIFGGLLYVISYFIPIENKTIVESYSETFTNITDLDIDSISSNLEIKVGNSFMIEASNLKNKLVTNNDNGKLKLSEKRKSFFNHNGNSGIITITIPSNTVFNEVEIKSGAGYLNIIGLNANDFSLDLGAGSIKIKDSTFSNTDIEGGAGQIEILNSRLNNLDLDSGIGKTDVSAYITGNSEIDCGIGEINIDLLGSKDNYTIYTNKDIGNLTVDKVQHKSYNIVGNGASNIKIDGGIGSINITFSNIEAS